MPLATLRHSKMTLTFVGCRVGPGVGFSVGVDVGDSVGFLDGKGEGASVGADVSGGLVGLPVGILVGPGLGCAVVGADVVGRAEGILDGEAVVGDRVDGFCVGDSVGLSVVG